MKKILLFAILSIFLLTGCGGNKLVCTMSQETKSGQYTIKMNGKFTMGIGEGEKVNSFEADVSA